MILSVLPGRQLPDHQRGSDQEHGKQQQVVEDAIPHGLAKRVQRHRAHLAHVRPPPRRARRGARPRRASGRRPRASPYRLQRQHAGAVSACQLQQGLGAPGFGDMRLILPAASTVTVAPASRSRALEGRAGTVEQHLPRPHGELHRWVMLPRAWRRPAARTSTRLHRVSASDRMWPEEDRLALVAQRQDEGPARRDGRLGRARTWARRESRGQGPARGPARRRGAAPMPLGNWPTAMRRSAPRPTRSSKAVARWRGRRTGVHRVAEVHQQFFTGQVVVEDRILGQEPDASSRRDVGDRQPEHVRRAGRSARRAPSGS